MRQLLIICLMLLGVVAKAQTSPQRAMYGTKDEVRAYPGLSRVFVVVPNLATSGLRTQETFAKDPNDSTSPESDSVIVASGGVRLKLLRNNLSQLPTPSIKFNTNTWNQSSDNQNRFYFEHNNKSWYNSPNGYHYFYHDNQLCFKITPNLIGLRNTLPVTESYFQFYTAGTPTSANRLFSLTRMADDRRFQFQDWNGASTNVWWEVNTSTNHLMLGNSVWVNLGGVVEVRSTDIELTTAAKGIILKSPNGTRYKLTVADNGTLTTTAL